jgi:hypothetical protein
MFRKGVMMIYAVHEHELKRDADVAQYERDVAAAIAHMNVPGLLAAHHLRGFRGVRANRYAVLWLFASEEAITENFGTLEQRRWPPDWAHYENVILAKYLDRHPDMIDYTDYHQVTRVDFSHTS